MDGLEFFCFVDGSKGRRYVDLQLFLLYSFTMKYPNSSIIGKEIAFIDVTYTYMCHIQTIVKIDTL